MTKSLEKLKNFINKIFFKFGYRISKINNTGELVKIHKYKNYEEYKETQIHYNKQKLDKVWADKDTLKLVSDFLKKILDQKLSKVFVMDQEMVLNKNVFSKKLLILRLLEQIYQKQLKILRIHTFMIFMRKKKSGMTILILFIQIHLIKVMIQKKH